MPLYKCKVSSINGLIGTEIYLPDDNRTRELLQRGIVEEIKPEPEKPKRKRRAKGGDDPQTASTGETIEYKGEG